MSIEDEHLKSNVIGDLFTAGDYIGRAVNRVAIEDWKAATELLIEADRRQTFCLERVMKRAGLGDLSVHQAPGMVTMDAQHDRELFPWLMGIISGLPAPAGGFLNSLAHAAVRADWENYPMLRPVLLQLRAKYPDYHDPFAVEGKIE